MMTTTTEVSIMSLTNDEIVKKYHDQQNKSKIYWLRYKIEIRILREKCKQQNITISNNEIVNDDEYKLFMKKLQTK